MNCYVNNDKYGDFIYTLCNGGIKNLPLPPDPTTLNMVFKSGSVSSCKSRASVAEKVSKISFFFLLKYFQRLNSSLSLLRL